jgi:hypothetical protein
VLVPLGGALLNAGAKEPPLGRTGTILLVTGGALLAASIPMLVTGAVLQTKGIFAEHDSHSVTLAPIVTATSGGGLLGIAGTF